MQQGSAADVAMCAMIQISNNKKLKELGWKLLLQVISSLTNFFLNFLAHIGIYKLCIN